MEFLNKTTCISGVMTATSVGAMTLLMGNYGACKNYIDNLPEQKKQTYDNIVGARAEIAFKALFLAVIGVFVLNKYYSLTLCNSFDITMVAMYILYLIQTKPDRFKSHLTPEEQDGYDVCKKQARKIKMFAFVAGIIAYFLLQKISKTN